MAFFRGIGNLVESILGWLAKVWDKVSGEKAAYRMESIYSNQIEIKRQLDKLDSRIEWLCSRQPVAGMKAHRDVIDDHY